MSRTWEGIINVGKIIASVEVTVYEPTQTQFGSWHGVGWTVDGDRGELFELFNKGSIVETEVGSILIEDPDPNAFRFKGIGMPEV